MTNELREKAGQRETAEDLYEKGEGLLDREELMCAGGVGGFLVAAVRHVKSQGGAREELMCAGGV